MRNIERISEDLGANYHQMQHFITESNWDHRVLINQVAQEVSQVLPKRKLTGLIIDESGWVKKGDHSVGVGHQYCGNVGKLSNSQVAVFACLSNGDFASMVDARLYLPKAWCDDKTRCEKAGVPVKHRTFKTKLELALEIIRQQVTNGIIFDFIGGDGYYGNDVDFASSIDLLGYLYMLDIHKDQKIYLERPDLAIPERKSNKGREPKKLKATTDELSVSKYLQTLNDENWQRISVRNTAKGVLVADYHFIKLWIINNSKMQVEQRLLVIRKTKTKEGKDEIKYSFTNANLEQYTKKAIAYMQAQRYFVEHCIKESKQILGLDQFQTRKWLAWQHQVALNFLVSSFILKEKLHCFDDLPLLSARDIKEFITFKLYKQMTEEQMIDRIYDRHLKRQRDINYSYSKL
ncbi:MAG: IS701 family transposase [Bacteroidota bacterium]|nr:MAG: IS701 family transposase [Bacteroidota bacterium]QQS52760.1 MAG: IS701 family transposase [Bacteroidota bacterium]QQS52765.1 MAG: IS701 family transposase [Bacteroidota bacterium]QQS52768.1 MAG: IS701 family transposase [Bacteroidota bacterium]QQS52777.1 MAG: IS701 family transposase [Bacteroidota bacterium]